MDHTRRCTHREATGPTASEFAAEGATFLVGMIRPAYPNRLAPQFKVTPVDRWFYPYTYIDDIGVRTGALADAAGVPDIVAALFAQKKSAAEVQAKVEARKVREGRRALGKTEDAQRQLVRWAAEDGVQNVKVWSVPSGKGHGILFTAGDDYVITRAQDAARKIAKSTDTYQTLTRGEGPNEWLLAFVTEPRYTPLSADAALTIADAVTDPGVMPASIDASVPGEIVVTEEPVSPASRAVVSRAVQGVAVGNFFESLKGAFGPKKPDSIRKKIAKIEAQLTYWKGKLAEAEASEGGAEGLVGSLVGAFFPKFGRAPEFFGLRGRGQRYGYAPAEVDELFGEEPGDEEAYGPDYGAMGDSGLQSMFRRGESADYGELGDEELDAMFEGAEEAEGVGEMPIAREDLEARAAEIIAAMAGGGLLRPREARRITSRIPEMGDEDLMDLVEDGEEDETGFMARATPMAMPTVTPPSVSSSARRARRKRPLRRLARGVRKVRRKVRRKVARKVVRRARGGASAPPQPQIIIIRQDGSQEQQGGDEYEDEGAEEEADGVGAYAYGGPGLGDAALRLGARSRDLPRSPNGYVINYPVG